MSTAEQALDLGSFRTLIALGTVDDCVGPMRVLDFGGAAGYHYLIARSTLPKSRRLDWRVVETTAMVRAARSMANDELGFFPTVQDAVASWTEVPPNLVFASGVLQYLPDPIQGLQDLQALQGEVLFVTRTALSLSDAPVTIVQRSTLAANGPGPLPPGVSDRSVAYPATFVPRSRFEAVLESSYEIVARIREDHFAYNAAGKSIDMYGYICRPR